MIWGLNLKKTTMALTIIKILSSELSCFALHFPALPFLPLHCRALSCPALPCCAALPPCAATCCLTLPLLCAVLPCFYLHCLAPFSTALRYLALPCLVLSFAALPRVTMTSTALPYLALLCLALRCHASRLAPLSTALPCLTQPYFVCAALPMLLHTLRRLALS